MRPLARAFAALLAVGGLCWGETGPADPLEAELKRFVEVFNLLDQRSASGFDAEDAVFHGAIPSMLRRLDPHSAFLDTNQFESLKEMQRSTEKGFGSVLNLLPGRAIVLQTLADSPSARAGIAPGDEIVVLNGYPLTQMPVEQMVALLSQSRQEKAQLMVKRPNFTKLLPMTLVPAELADPSVSRHFVLEDGIGYAKVVNFEAATAQELFQAIDSLGADELEGLVLDLRGNPGGIVEVAIQVAAFFLNAGERILWISGRHGPSEDLTVPEGYQPFEFPLAILVDERTASAAELVTGALQDHDRARVFGERSYGKGLVQSVYEMTAGTGLALTTAYYLTPEERMIQRSMGDCREFQLEDCNDTRSVDDRRGGIVPDQMVRPMQLTRLEAVLKASNSFYDFARSYVRSSPDIEDDFEPDGAMLDDFHSFLANRRIHPHVSEWAGVLGFIRANLKQEVLNLAFGVEKGDEVELRLDPVVKAGIRWIKSR